MVQSACLFYVFFNELSVLCFVYLVTVGGHFPVVRKWWSSSIFMFKKNWHKLSVLIMASSDSQIDTPQHGCPQRAELPDININTGVN